MENKDILAVLGENPTRREILEHWDPENEVFWKRWGERIAKQNLYTSTWALTLAFVAWTMSGRRGVSFTPIPPPCSADAIGR